MERTLQQRASQLGKMIMVRNLKRSAGTRVTPADLATHLTATHPIAFVVRCAT